MPKHTKTITVKITEEMYENLQLVAQNHTRNVGFPIRQSDVVRRAIENYTNQQFESFGIQVKSKDAS